MDIYYRNWKKERGEGIEVNKIKFVGYDKLNDYLHVFEEEGVEYIGELWRCRLPNGKVETLKFREEFSGDRGNIGWAYTELGDAVSDNLPNILVDSWETVLDYLNGDSFSYRKNAHTRRYPNTQLEEWGKERDILEANLWKFYLSTESDYPLREVARTRYELEAFPSLKAANKWNRFSKGNRKKFIKDFEEYLNPKIEL